MASDADGRGRGRPAVSSRAEIERVAMRLFAERGFSGTTIPMIAEASGVSRTTVFRYWGSKSEIVWAEFDLHIRRLANLLEADRASTQSTLDIVRRVLVSNLALSIEDSPVWLARFELIDAAEDLRDEEARHWADWAATIAAFVAHRHGYAATGVVPQGVAGAVQGAFLAVLRSVPTEADIAAPVLLPVLDEALRSLADALQSWIEGTPFSENRP